MTSLTALYQLAEQEHIAVDCYELRSREALSIMTTDGSCAIAIDPFQLRSEQEEREKLAHELGHCVQGAFYNVWASRDLRRRHENQADKWAIHKLIPAGELDQAIADGYTELWQLAEHFGVTEDFMRKAVCLYVHGNLDTSLYF